MRRGDRQVNAMTSFPSIATALAGSVRRAVLRPYQQDGKDGINAAWAAGHTNVLAVYPTGAGKTVLMSDIVADNRGGAVLIAHRQELVGQIAEAINNAGVRFRLICPKPVRQQIIARLLKKCSGPLMFDANATVGVGGVDTLVNAGKKPEHKDWIAAVNLWVCDEAHHVLAENKWGRAIELFPCKDLKGLGLTATPARTDGKGLGRHADGVFDFMVQGPAPAELIAEGYLSPFRFWTVPCTVHYEDVPVGDSGEFIQAKLVAAEEADERLVGDIVANYAKRTPGKRAICFLSSIKKAEEVAQKFRDAGFTAQSVDGKTDPAIRAKAMEDLESGALQVLANCDLVGEGTDIPAVEVVILGTATASFIRFSQWVGRGLRLMLNGDEKLGFNDLSPAERRARIAGSVKPFAFVFDHGGNCIRHGGPPDMPRVYTLDRREGRGGGTSELTPYRICANPGYSEPRGGWEKWRAAGWTSKQMLEHGHISLGYDAIPCAQPYERIHRECPHCGFYPEPQTRKDMEHVEGDLQELDEETLAAIRQQVSEANQTVEQYREYMAGTRVNGLAQMANVKRHAERLEALEELRDVMGQWGGHWKQRGDNDSQLQRRFYHLYGIDVLSAQALKRQEADTLRERILTSLSRMGRVGSTSTNQRQSA